MKQYYVGLYILISVIIIYLFSTLLVHYNKNIENFKQISDYQTDGTFLKSLEGKDMKPKIRLLNVSSPILPQLEGTYQGQNDLKDTYWKIDKNGQLISAYGLYGTISVVSPQKVQDDFVYLNFKNKAGKIYEARYNGSQYIMIIKSKVFMLELIDDPAVLPLEISNISSYIGNIKGSDYTQYSISKEGFIINTRTNIPIAQLTYSSNGPPYQNEDNTYTFAFKYIDASLQEKFGKDVKNALLSKSELNVYGTDNELLATYTKVLAQEPVKPVPVPTKEFGFSELNAPILEGCTQTALGETSYYDKICINAPYYIINYDQLLCLSVGSDGKTIVLEPIEANNPKQVWTPRQYRLEDRYNNYDHPWCIADLEAEEDNRYVKYKELKNRGKWMRPETIYPRNPPKNKVIQSKIDYRVKDGNADFLLENSTSRSFVKGQFNEKTTLLELGLIPANIQTKKREGYEFNTPVYENISPTCLYKCNASKAERDNILEEDPYATNQKNRNCPYNPYGAGCIDTYDPPCNSWNRDCWWQPWYYERPRHVRFWWWGWHEIQVGTVRTLGGHNYVCGGWYCTNDPAPYCTKYACGDTRTQQFNGTYQQLQCNDKYDNYGEMTRFRFEGNVLEVVTRVQDKYNSLAVKNNQYVESNDRECFITYSDINTDPITNKRTWYFIPVAEIDRILPKLKELKRNIPLEKLINDNVKKLDS